MDRKWFQKAGDESDVVISTRVRLARNLAGMPFPCRMTPEQKAKCEKQVRDAILESHSAVAADFTYLEMDALSGEEAVSLVERHLVSPDFIASSGGRGILLSKDESVSIMINEEDHVRIQILHEGLALTQTAEMADRVDTLLNESMHFAFDPSLGYLTQCPTNLGTGMRASVMLHLPALSESGAMARIAANLSKLGLVLRGTYGEGTQVAGAMYQLSNQITLGLSETEAIENLQNIAMQLIGEERRARKALMQSIAMQDKIGRSAGILHGAKMLTTEEYMRLISNIRLGIAENMLIGVRLEEINALTAAVQPATLAASQKEALTAEQRDILRAVRAKEALAGLK